MASNKHEFKTAIFEDGTCTVLRADSAKPHFLEVIATFYDAAHARDYVKAQNTPADDHWEERPALKPAVAAKPEQALKAKPITAPAAKPKLVTEVKPRIASEAKLKPASKAKPVDAVSDLTERQAAVLKALRSKMDKKNRVESRAVELAKAASIPLGSLHSVLASLEKKQMIRTERQGSAQFAAIYEVLETARKSAGTINGVAHGKEANAAGTAH